jgi:glucose/arabinose dehydrogenase
MRSGLTASRPQLVAAGLWAWACVAGVDSSGEALPARVPNTTISLPPELPADEQLTYKTVDAFPAVALTNPIALATAPGETNRLYVVERAGYIVVITNLLSPTRKLFLNVANRINAASEGGLLGLAFHPEYASNRFFFVYYTAAGTGFSNRVARFQRLGGDPDAADPASEVVLFGQHDEAQNHNGGTVHFGPDGYLYVGLGDEGGGNDTFANSQRIDKDFFSGILRIDVDKRPGSLPPNPHPSIVAPTNYAIPPDNPWVGATNFLGSAVDPSRVRTEFWAVGLRNPFRFSFDPVTHECLCADVGQNAWEEIDLIVRGGNYGWAYREGFEAGPKPGGPPASAFISPLLAYAHGSATNQGNSITGGIVYRGDRMPELVGSYIFSDYVSGNIWAMTHNGVTNTSFRRLATNGGLVGFGADPVNGDLLGCDLSGNEVKRLVYASTNSALPFALRDTGVFQDLQALTPNPGILAYDINVPFWSDNAIKRRWFSIPDTNLTVTFRAEAPWLFPSGAVWIKHFDLELTSGVPASVRRLETRILVREQASENVYGITYRWGGSTSNATLVPAGGLDEAILVDGGGVTRTQVWHYPGRGECLVCHHGGTAGALGFGTEQLNRDFDYGVLVTNQIAALDAMGYIAEPVTNLFTLRRLAPATNEACSLTQRVRSYLHANCAQCHYPGGTAPANFDARVYAPLSQAGLIDGPLNDTMGNTSNRVVVRGSLTNSMLLTRISMSGPGRMPPLASSVLDTQAIALVSSWITGPLTDYLTFPEWQVLHFGSMDDPRAPPDADPDGDGAVNFLEYLTGTSPVQESEAWGVSLDAAQGVPRIVYDHTPDTGFRFEFTTNLAEGVGWVLLDVPGVEPFFSAAPFPAAVEDGSGGDAAERFYRARVFEP